MYYLYDDFFCGKTDEFPTRMQLLASHIQMTCQCVTKNIVISIYPFCGDNVLQQFA